MSETTTKIEWANIDENDEPREGFTRIWVMQAYGHKFTKQNEYGTQVAFVEEPDAAQIEQAQLQVESYMRQQSIRGDIRYEFLTYLAPEEIVPNIGENENE